MSDQWSRKTVTRSKEMITFFILLQSVLLLFMLFHDWIPIPPFNDIAALKKVDSYFYRLFGSLINGVVVFIPMMLTWKFYGSHTIALPDSITIFSFYFLITIGTILSWWIPYFFGSSTQHKQRFTKFKNTHHFLPERRDHVIPNTLHIILHLQIWACLFIAGYFIIQHFLR